MLTVNQIQADTRRMERFICERISPGGTRIVLAAGGDGPAWADLSAFWDDDGDCDLLIETNEPDAFGFREVYEHFRRQERTSWEREHEISEEMNRWKVHELERENSAMGFELNNIRQTTLDPQVRADAAIPLIPTLAHLASIAKSLARIADAVDPPPPDKVDTAYVAKKLGIGLARVSQMATGGEIPPSCIVAGTGNGKLWKFHRARIDEWIENGRT